MIYPPLQEPESSNSPEPRAPASDSMAFSRESRLQGLVLSALEGNINRGRALKYWENLRLKPQHVQMLMMKAAGFTNNSIAEQMQLTAARVSVIVNHPDSLSLLSTMVSFQAEELIDIKTRIKAHSAEALDVALDVMRNGKDEVRARTAFALLDRAGYGAVQRAEIKHEISVPATAAANIANAMRESKEVEEAEWSFEPIKIEESPTVEKVVLSSESGDSAIEGGSLSNASEPPVDGYSDNHPTSTHIQIRRTA